ncbi:MAG: PorP/SprF family type IX secretion system membrane protein [Bacteroidia bacterium]|nr:PorP/SprF family type IX secretion system membrane protein [Bacteroidia bacterium]
MIKCKYIFVFVVFLCTIHASRGQDMHFSQYYLSPLTLNPANTGNYRGDYRFFGNYRSQWRDLDKGYNTFTAGGDVNMYPNNFNISPGLLFMSDKSSLNLNVTKVIPSFAIHLKPGAFKVHLGVQPAVVFKAIDFYKHSFPEQMNWNTGGFDNTMPNSEPNVNQRTTYFDLNAGAVISRKFGKVEPEIGAAWFHINQPNESLIGNKSNRLPVRTTYNAAISIDATRSFIVKLHSMYGYTTKANDWVSGLHFEYVVSRGVFFDNSVFAGFMWRDGFNSNADAGIVTAGLNWSHYTLGFSYDITMSELKTSVNSKGAYEIALIWRAKSSRLTKRVIPCERY